MRSSTTRSGQHASACSNARSRRRPRRRRGPRVRGSAPRPRAPSGRPRRRAPAAATGVFAAVGVSVTTGTVPPAGSRPPSRLGDRARSERCVHGELAANADVAKMHPGHERQPDPFDLRLRHPAEISDRDRDERSPHEQPDPPIAQPRDRHDRRGPIASANTARSAKRKYVYGRWLAAPSQYWCASPRNRRTTRSRRRRTRRTPAACRRRPEPGAAPAPRDATAIGMNASRTKPYDRNAVTPNSSSADQRQRVGPAPVASGREHDAVTAHAETPAKNASAEDHQIAAGASTTNGIAARALRSSATSRSATSAATPAAAPPARERTVFQPTPPNPTCANAQSRISIPGGWPRVCVLYEWIRGTNSDKNTWGSWINLAVFR